MNEDVKSYLSKYPGEIISLYGKLRELIIESVGSTPDERLWAKLPSYYLGESFVRLIPFKDHINIEASAMLSHADELPGYKLTPKGMLQLTPKQPVPADILRKVFNETLTQD